MLLTLFEAIGTKTVTPDPPFTGDTLRGSLLIICIFIHGIAW